MLLKFLILYVLSALLSTLYYCHISITTYKLPYWYWVIMGGISSLITVPIAIWTFIVITDLLDRKK